MPIMFILLRKGRTMKKIIALLLALSVCLSFAACSKDSSRYYDDEDNYSGDSYSEDDWSDDKTDQQDDWSEPEVSVAQLENDFATASNFYDGKAIVETHDGEYYCINAKGEILFQIPAGDMQSFGPYSLRGGFIRCTNGWYNTDGLYKSNDELGIKDTFDIAIDDGYLIATVVESTYDSATYKLGVLDNSFNWIISPSEELYPLLTDIYGRVNSNTCRYGDGYLYLFSKDCYLSLLTGEIMDQISGGEPANLWNNWKDMRGNTMATLEIDGSMQGKFIDERAIVIRSNPAGDLYFFMVDTEGKAVFEPVAFPDGVSAGYSGYMDTDGTHIKFQTLEGKNVTIYDDHGVIIAHWDATEEHPLGNEKQVDFNWSLSDGTLLLHEDSPRGDHYYYYDVNFDKLF